MGFSLSAAARDAGHRLHVHDTLGSTNTEALARARAGEGGPLWVVARRQSAGRGRRGNGWVSREGNLAASVLWPVDRVPADAVATLGFVAGLALIGALDDVAGASAQVLSVFALKWPNDVLAGAAYGGAPVASSAAGSGTEGSATPPRDPGGKLAGILLEAETAPGGRRVVIIGWGVNVAAAPEGLPYPVTSLAALGLAASAEALFEALSARMRATAALWDGGRGFGHIRQRWLARAAGLGAPLAVRLPGGTLHGIHDGIDEGGRLVILAPDGTRRTVTAGDVHFGTAATAA